MQKTPPQPAGFDQQLADTAAQKVTPTFSSVPLKPGSKVMAGPAKYLNPSRQKQQNAPAPPAYVVGTPSSAQFTTFGPVGQQEEEEPGSSLAADLAALANSGTLRNALVKAVKDALGQWRLQAHFRDIKIHAVTALGGPGCLTGPDLEYLILHQPGTVVLGGLEEQVAEAVAQGVDHCFDQWRSKVTVPGLPWYPAFAAWPGPVAPPMPNVPCPLITCISAKVTAITVPGQLKSAMFDALPGELKRPEIVPLLEQVATLLAAHFTQWLATQQVSLVMGRGPVPSFAPPFVPVGPVVNGSIIEAPPHVLA